MDKMENKVRGALYGVSLGDALGGPLEFLDADQISRKHGRVTNMIGGGWLGLEPGEVTDDTQMTIAVANGIAKSKSKIGRHARLLDDHMFTIVEDIGDEFIAWWQSSPKDIGSTCRSSIGKAVAYMHQGQKDVDAWKNAADNTDKLMQGKTAGNGTLMRTIYPALYFNNIEDAVRVARLQSGMTHKDSLAADCCEEYVRLVFDCIRDDEQRGRVLVRERTYELNARGFLPTDLEPNGFVLNALGIALRCVASARTAREAIEYAANGGGDADTIAAITGGLAGAVWGFDAMPDEWVQCLDKKLTARFNMLTDMAMC